MYMDNLINRPCENDYINFSMGNLVRKEEESDKKVDPSNQDFNINGLVKENPWNKDYNFTVARVPEDELRTMLPKPDLHPINSAIPFNNKRLSNWFSRLLDKKGQDYISSGKLTSDEVARNVERIIEDMINGKIDYNQYGYCIILPQVIETLINYCSNKIAINSAIKMSLGYIYNDYLNRANIDSLERMNFMLSISEGMFRNITQAIAIVDQDVYTYTLLYNKFIQVNSTKNISVLFGLSNELKVYNKIAKNRY